MIQGSLDDLRAQLARNENRDIGLTTESRWIAAEVGRLVVAIQGQDIVAQKIAHILKALEGIEDVQGFEVPAGSSSPSSTRYAHSRDICRVEAAQLRAVRADLEKTQAEMFMAVDAIGAHADALDQMASQLPEFEHLTCAHDGMVEVLLGAIEGVHRIAMEAEAGIGAAYEAVCPLRGQTSNVTATIRVLSAQMRQVALNAQVHAARVGRGTGLDVVASQVACIANQTLGLSERIASDLDGQISCISHAVEEFATLRDGCRNQCEALRVQGQEQEDALHRYRDEALNGLLQTGAGIRELGKRAGSIRDAARWMTIVAAEVEPMSALLDHVASMAGELVRMHGGSPNPSAFIQTLAQHYTMASEMAVHQLALGYDPIVPSGLPLGTDVATERTVDFSDVGAKVGRDIEFDNRSFHEPAAVVPIGIAGEKSSSVCGSVLNVVPAESSLGENVELF